MTTDVIDGPPLWQGLGCRSDLARRWWLGEPVRSSEGGRAL